MLNTLPICPTSFTQRWDFVESALYTSCLIKNVFCVSDDLPSTEGLALWDTGATNSVINSRVVEALSLQPVGVTAVQGVGGVSESFQYVVGIVLPNKLHFEPVLVTLGYFEDFEILIGMDIIISTGSFALTNKDEKTVMSFSVPSLETIDFVEKYRKSLA